MNYLVNHANLQQYYRQDIQKIETRAKLCIKDSEEIKKEEEFVNVETSYKKVR